MLRSKGHMQLALLTIVSALALSSLFAAQPALAAKGPKHLDFYIYIAVAVNNTNLTNPIVPVNAVQSAQPVVRQPFSFGIIHTFDSVITSAPEFNSTRLGRVQGYYGDVGQDFLTLLFVATFTWNDGKYNGTFSMLGVDVANDSRKFVPIVGGTGDFAYVRGVAEPSQTSTVTVNNDTVAWFHYSIDFKY